MIHLSTEPLHFLHYEECILEHEVNNHSKLTIRGHVADVSVSSFLDSLDKPLALHYTHHDVKMVWEGVIRDCLVYKRSGNSYAEVTVIGKTIEWDRIPQSKTIIANSLTLKSILEHTEERELSGMLMGSQVKERFESGWLVQYEETDWQFLKRLARRKNIPLFVEDCSETDQSTIEIRCGFFPISTSHPLEVTDLLALSKERAQLTSRQKYIPGQRLKIEHQDFAIVRSKYLLHDFGAFTAVYDLVTPSCWKNEPYSHPLKGRTLRATVIGNRDEQKKGRLAVQLPWEKEKEGISRMIPWATPFSMNQVGFHALPQLGETVYMFFPSDDEEEAFLSLVERKHAHDDLEDGDTHYWRTADGVQIKLAKGSLALSIPDSEKDETKRFINIADEEVRMDYDERHLVFNKKEIKLHDRDHTVELNDEGISLALQNGAMIKLESSSIMLKIGNTSLTMDDNGLKVDGKVIEMAGKEVKIESSQAIDLKSGSISMRR